MPIKEVPEKEGWPLGLLDSLLKNRGELVREGKETKRVVAMISLLCTT